MVVTDDKQKLSLLLTLIGDDAYEIYENILPQDTDHTFQQVIDAFNNHFKPQVNTSYETFLFRKMLQRTEESTQQYYVRLHEQAMKCDFTNIDTEIKQQIELSTNSSKLRKYSFQNPGKSLQEILSIAKTFEVMKIQTEELEKRAVTEDINAVADKHKEQGKIPNFSSKRTHPSRYEKYCYRCGGPFPHPDTCPASGKICNSCGKPGHFARVCQSTRSQPNPRSKEQRGSNQRTQGEYSKPLNAVTCESCRCRGFSERKSEPHDVFSANISNKHTRIAKEEVSESKMNFETTVIVENKPIKVLIDTGASINVMNYRTFNEINKTLKAPLQLKSSKAHVVTYGNDFSNLKIEGEVSVLMESKRNFLQSTFFVINTEHKNLLSGTSAAALGMIKVNNLYSCDEANNNETPREESQNIPQRLKATISSFADSVFNGKIGKLKNYQVKLKINENVPPVAQRERRIPFAIREQVQAELSKLEECGIIESVTDEATPWISPMVIVPKNNGKIRICIDMRAANKAIGRTRFPTPTLDDVMIKLRDAKVFSKLDLLSAFHQLELTPESRSITTFQTETGIKRFKRLNFGVNSAQEELQNAIREVLRGIDGTINIADDILVYARNAQEHDLILEKVLQRFKDKGLTLNLDKCTFAKESLKFFGFIFSSDGMHPDPEKIEEIKHMPIPEDAKALQSFLGLMNYFKRFIPQYSTLTHPLRKLLHKDTPWKWNSDCQSSFDNLTNALSSESCVGYFDPNKETVVYTDASPVGISAVIVQNTAHKKDHKLISYSSRSLTPTEQRYSQIERECLAIVYACEHNKLYLYGQTFQIFCDHKPIVNTLNNPNATVPLRIERMTLRLQGFSFNLYHVRGEDNISDYPSRHPAHNITETSTNIEKYINFVTKYALPNAITMQDMRKETKNDVVLQLIAKIIRQNSWQDLERPIQDPEIRQHIQTLLPYRNIRRELTVNDTSDIILKGNRIVVPIVYQDTVIKLAHHSHMGLAKTKALLRSKVYFPNLDERVEWFIRNCATCQTLSRPNPPAPLAITPTPEMVWEIANADYLGPLPNGQYVIVLIDQASKFPIAEVVRTTSADIFIEFLQKTIATFGIPNTIITDNGPPFKSHQLEQFFKKLGIRHQRITPLWPQANAQVESFMKPLMKAIRTAYLEKQDWKKRLQNFLFSYRNTPHCTTGISPSTMMFNRITNFTIPSMPQQINNNIAEEARQKQQDSKIQRKAYHDNRSHAKEPNINIGDTVLIKQRKQNKLTPQFEPQPYIVTEKNETMITAKSPYNQEEKTRNASHMKSIPSNIKFNAMPETEDDEDLGQQYKPEHQQRDKIEQPQRPPLVHRYPRRERAPVESWRKY